MQEQKKVRVEGEGEEFAIFELTFQNQNAYINILTGSMDTFHEEIKLGSPSLGASLNTHL